MEYRLRRTVESRKVNWSGVNHMLAFGGRVRRGRRQREKELLNKKVYLLASARYSAPFRPGSHERLAKFANMFNLAQVSVNACH